MIDVFLAILAFAALISGSITDLKKREVPDWISYGLIFSAIGTRLLYSIYNNDYHPILFGIEGFAVMFAISNILYYTKQWGGGDAKILMGLGAVIGLDILNLKSYMNWLILFLALIFLGAVYGIGWSLWLAYNNKKRFKASFIEQIKDYRYLMIAGILFFAISLFTMFTTSDYQFSFLFLGVSIIFLTGMIAFAFTKAVEDSCLIMKVKASQLTEGDWVMETIKINGKTIISEKNLGITRPQLDRLKGYRKPVTIKIGIPFIPAFLLSYMALIAYGALY